MILNTYRFLTFTALFFVQITWCQINKDLRPAVKSPEVDKFEQYLNLPVNMVSGTPQVTIPIYTLSYGGMTLPISLEYDASGVKVDDISSSVGLKWSLNVGGVVSRIVKGAPDEGNIDSHKNVSGIVTRGYYQDKGFTNLKTALANAPKTQEGINLLWNNWLSDVQNGFLDDQPDLYYFSTPEGGSKFVFSEQRQVVYLENTDFVVNVNNYIASANSLFDSWNVVSPNGIKYTFGSNNLKEESYSGSVGESLFYFKTNSWFLNEIMNFSTNEKVTLEYVDNNYSTINNVPPIFNTSPCVAAVANGSQCTGSESSEYVSFATNSSSFSRTENHFKSKLISKIKAGATEINFIYNTLREDVAALETSTPYFPITAKRLDEIQIIYNGQIIKKFKFNYTTTISSDAPASVISNPIILQKRLVLNGLTESSQDEVSVKPYVFEYNTTPLPNKLSFAQDKWGYYNGKTNNPSLIPSYKFYKDLSIYADRSVDSIYSRAGMLQKIIYPTKGSVNFEYQSHKSNVATDMLYDLENPVGEYLRINSSSAINGTYSEDFTYHAQDDIEIILKSTLGGRPDANCPVTYAVAAQLQLKGSSVIIAQTNYGGKSSNVIDVVDKSKLIDGGVYTLTGYSYKDPQGNSILCRSNICSVLKIKVSPVYDFGGMRLGKITHKDSDNGTLKEVKYKYSQPSVTTIPKNIYKIQYDYINMLYGLYSYPTIMNSSDASVLQGIINRNSANFKTGYYYTLSSGIDPLEINFKGPDISYGNVIETSGNGQTENNFYPYKSYFELNNHSYPLAIPANPVFQSLSSGDKLSVIEKNSAGNELKKSVYTNDNYEVTTADVVGINVNYTEYGNIYNPYRIRGQIKTLKTVVGTSTFGGTTVDETVSYEYTGTNHNQPTKKTVSNSKGETLISKMYYPGDLSSEPFMSNLIAQNRKATPVKLETYKNATALGDKLSEQKTVYANDATTSNLVLPKSIYEAKFPNSLPSILNVGQLERKVTSDLYNTNGILLQFTPENGQPVSMIWGYNKTQPIAKIENATYAEITGQVANLQTLSNTGTEANLILALTNLRTSLPNAMITTYTYRPLIGVSTTTDPKGNVTYYNYDGLGRLQNVKDAKGNILSENQYHYKN